jgi:hypothetical protein
LKDKDGIFRHQIGIIGKQLGIAAISKVFQCTSRGCVLFETKTSRKPS